MPARKVYSIELRHLRYFVVAEEYGSFRKAGVALGICQSAISRRIADLEDRIGASLFHRHAGGVSLTYAGERFLHKAKQGLRAVDEGRKTVAAIGRGEEGILRIGILSSLASGFLTDLIREYEERHSKVRIDFMDGEPAEHVAAVRQLRVDVAFITGTAAWSDCETTYLWSERVFAAMSIKHRLAVKEEVEWADLAEEIFIVSGAAPGQGIHDYLTQRLADLANHPEIHLQRVGRDNLLPLVALGRRLTVIGEAGTVSHIPGITYRAIAGEILPFSAVWSPKNDNPACRRLLSLARSMARSRQANDVMCQGSRKLRAAPSRTRDRWR